MFFLEYHDMLSGGALGSLFVGLVTCYMWEGGRPRCASSGPCDTFAPDVERVMAVVSTQDGGGYIRSGELAGQQANRLASCHVDEEGGRGCGQVSVG